MIALACLSHGWRVDIWQDLFCVLNQKTVELGLSFPVWLQVWPCQRNVIGAPLSSCEYIISIERIPDCIGACMNVKGQCKSILQGLAPHLCRARRYKYLSISCSCFRTSSNVDAMLILLTCAALDTRLTSPASRCICRSCFSRLLVVYVTTQSLFTEYTSEVIEKIRRVSIGTRLER